MSYPLWWWACILALPFLQRPGLFPQLEQCSGRISRPCLMAFHTRNTAYFLSGCFTQMAFPP